MSPSARGRSLEDNFPFFTRKITGAKDNPAPVSLCAYAYLPSQRGDPGTQTLIAPEALRQEPAAPGRRFGLSTAERWGKSSGPDPALGPAGGTNGGGPEPGLPGGCLFACPPSGGAPRGAPSPAAPGAGLAAGRGGPGSPKARSGSGGRGCTVSSPGGESRSGAVSGRTP